MNLMKFQLNAMRELLLAMEEERRDIILKSPTGSGKTIMLTHFMSEYIKGHARTVFVWLTPGKGNLEEQSKRRMDAYIHNSQTKLLGDVMTGGFAENDCCFINWEKLTKKGNNALKDSERTNFLEWIERALGAGLQFKVIIDESHQNFTEKADAIVQLFKTDKIIRCSATPLIDKGAKLIEISEAEVIAEGLIKKLLVINGEFPQTVELEDEGDTKYLLRRAFEKRSELAAAFAERAKSGETALVNPLIVVQLPNNSDALLERVQQFFEAQSVSVENGLLAVWLSSRHENLDGIEANGAPQVAVIIKQAVATGWDCPRAETMMSFRHASDATYIAQLLGRMVRTPMQSHIKVDETLNDVHLYLPYFDEKTVSSVVNALQSEEGGAIPTDIYGESTEEKRYIPLVTKPKGHFKPKQPVQIPGQISLFGDTPSPPTSPNDDAAIPDPPVKATSALSSPMMNTTVHSGELPIVNAAEHHTDKTVTAPQTPEDNIQKSAEPEADLFDRDEVVRFINDLGLLTYEVRTVRINNYIKSLFSMAHLLTQTGLYPDAVSDIHSDIIKMIHEYVNSLKESEISSDFSRNLLYAAFLKFSSSKRRSYQELLFIYSPSGLSHPP